MHGCYPIPDYADDILAASWGVEGDPADIPYHIKQELGVYVSYISDYQS